MIYFIADERGRTKIGWSRTHPQRARRGELQTANADRLEVVGALDLARSWERRLHHRFRDRWVRGEWYRLSAHEAQAVVVEMEGYFAGCLGTVRASGVTFTVGVFVGGRVEIIEAFENGPTLRREYASREEAWWAIDAGAWAVLQERERRRLSPRERSRHKKHEPAEDELVATVNELKAVLNAELRSHAEPEPDTDERRAARVAAARGQA